MRGYVFGARRAARRSAQASADANAAAYRSRMGRKLMAIDPPLPRDTPVFAQMLVPVFANEDRPTRERILRRGYQSASDAFAKKITAAEDQYVSPDKVTGAFVMWR
ncbi:MAG TPA: hypothetical protein PLM09_03070 [Casimicrobiaceae bacterium]|nr:hypothetical protein [Casimicrobiaceae bacterium]